MPSPNFLAFSEKPHKRERKTRDTETHRALRLSFSHVSFFLSIWPEWEASAVEMNLAGHGTISPIDLVHRHHHHHHLYRLTLNSVVATRWEGGMEKRIKPESGRMKVRWRRNLFSYRDPCESVLPLLRVSSPLLCPHIHFSSPQIWSVFQQMRMKHEAMYGGMKQNNKRNSLKVMESDGLNRSSDIPGEWV